MSIDMPLSLSPIEQLGRTNKAIEDSLIKLSSGSKVNSASDDPAAFAVIKSLQKSLSSSNIARDNMSLGNNMLSCADGYLEQIRSNLGTIRECAQKAASNIFGDSARKAYIAQGQECMKAINDIVANAKFNGMNLLDGSIEECIIQTGESASSILDIAKAFQGIDFASFGLSEEGIMEALSSASSANAFLENIDGALETVSDQQSIIGSYQNALSSRGDALEVGYNNTAASLSAMKDIDYTQEIMTLALKQQQQSVLAGLVSNMSDSLYSSLYGNSFSNLYSAVSGLLK